MKTDSDVLIVGGGVVGAACAHFLTASGAKVTVIDRGEIGHGCSYGNAGLIVPSHSFPLPMPGAIYQALFWLFRADSPFYIKPRLSWDLIRWLLRFAGCSTKAHLAHATRALAQLSLHSSALYDQLAAENGAQMHFTKNGALYPCATSTGLKHAIDEMEILRAYGVGGRILGEDEVRQLEPAITGPVCGATYFENEPHAEPLAVVKTLMRLAEERGASVRPRTELIEWEFRGRRIESVRTTRGILRADHFVLAGGSWSPQIARPLGLRVPIQAGKGYAVTIKSIDPMPKIPVLLNEVKVGVTPRADSLRLAGTLELAGLDESITMRRVRAVMRGARQFYNIPEEPEVVEVWRGLRPCTPDGLPILGRHDDWENLTLAAGHAMLGMTLATASGQLVADLITGQTPSVDPAPFRPGRFR